jgi:hypothetical protein
MWPWPKWLTILAFEYPIERQRRLRRGQEGRERHDPLDADLTTAACRFVKSDGICNQRIVEAAGGSRTSAGAGNWP